MSNNLARLFAGLTLVTIITLPHPTATNAETRDRSTIRQVGTGVWSPTPVLRPLVLNGYEDGFWGEIPEFDLIRVAQVQQDILSDNPGIDSIVVGSVQASNDVKKYCYNILDEAKEARHAVLAKRLQDMQAAADIKLNELDNRISELKTWMQKREQFLASAKDSLVQIFQTMRSDSAAQQLTEMDTVLSAAIIAKLEPKFSSAILAEMAPEDAAEIAMMLTHAVTLDE